MQSHVKGKAVLCMLKTNVHDHVIYKIKLDELRRLVETLNIEVVGEVVQSRHRSFAKYHVGSGKVKEIRRYVQRHSLNLVVFYNYLRSSQKINLIRALGVDVVDRYEVTLEIFDRMSSDNLSKLQIEAARLEKLAPYFKLEASLRYHNDRPFFRSMGEYAFHSQLRELTRRQARIRKQIESLVKENRQRIRKRQRLGFPTVCIAGYYNAGKTSLFNALTGDDKLVSDRPFTTLSSKYQRRFVDHETTLLFIDTIGFVIDVDPNLIRSFELNIEDMRNADLVILLLDITDPSLILRIKLSEGVRLLRGMGVPREHILVVINKTDLKPSGVASIGEELDLQRLGLPWTTVSAKARTNLEGLLELITTRLKLLTEPVVHPGELKKVETVEPG
ncbi:MAG: GTPase HflX [Candidatus Bathyarchaeota archaeon]|nr:MAG: GTPase HflX [Candidatus Bathyarchaeota archaeon]